MTQIKPDVHGNDRTWPVIMLPTTETPLMILHIVRNAWEISTSTSQIGGFAVEIEYACDLMDFH